MNDDAASPVPLLDLAPKLDRPLSLWNPLDYLRVLYWVFFFPQALRWYVEGFRVQTTGPTIRETRSGRWGSLRRFLARPTSQRDLFLQGLLATVATSVIAGALLPTLGLPIDWIGMALGVAFGVALGVAFGMDGGLAVGMVLGVEGGVAGGVMGGVAGGVVGGMVGGVMGDVAFSVASGLASNLVIDELVTTPGFWQGVVVSAIVLLSVTSVRNCV